ncbi:MAG: hypothetical protein GY839_02695 [candidate division Zixibacteria bacterium]|nr:hypothetical protein [candidate division Zixibacteria bacterium]
MAKEVVGLVVDGVSEVLRVESDTLEDAPKPVSGESTYSGAEYLKSIAKLADRFLIYLDLGKIISTRELPAA